MNKLLVIFVFTISGCVNAPIAAPGSGGLVKGDIPLSWEKGHPERQIWSEALRDAIRDRRGLLDKAQGFEPWCSKLSEDFWAELFVKISYYESGWKPETVFHEPQPLDVDSIGLFQLSYSSDKNHPGCEGIDPKTKSLKDPLVNIRCAVGIMARFIEKDGVLAEGFKSGSVKGLARYFSVMRSLKNGKPRDSFEGIKKHTKSLAFCK